MRLHVCLTEYSTVCRVISIQTLCKAVLPCTSLLSKASKAVAQRFRMAEVFIHFTPNTEERLNLLKHALAEDRKEALRRLDEPQRFRH